ncbi:MAG: hypothetical protein RLZZ385_72 [Pseudomonadota bacterium]|jgi:hypothetical protein
MKQLMMILMSLVLVMGTGTAMAKDKDKQDSSYKGAAKYSQQASHDDDDDDRGKGSGKSYSKGKGKDTGKDRDDDDDDDDHDYDKDRHGHGYGHCKAKGKGHHKDKHHGWDDDDDCDDDNPPPPPPTPVCVAAAGPFDPVESLGSYTVNYNYIGNQSALVSVPGIVGLTYSGQLCAADGLSAADGGLYTATETFAVDVTLTYVDPEDSSSYSQLTTLTVSCVLTSEDVAPQTTLPNGDYYFAFETTKQCSVVSSGPSGN